MAKTAVAGDDFDPRKIAALVLGLGGAAAVGWKLINGGKPKPIEVLSAVLGVLGYFSR